MKFSLISEEWEGASSAKRSIYYLFIKYVRVIRVRHEANIVCHGILTCSFGPRSESAQQFYDMGNSLYSVYQSNYSYNFKKK